MIRLKEFRRDIESDAGLPRDRCRNGYQHRCERINYRASA